MKKIIVNTFGNDQPGIVSKISGMVSSLNGNIVKSEMVKIDNIFSIIMIINIPNENEKTLIDKINRISKLYSTVKNIDSEEINKTNYNKYSFSLECLDNEGIIYHFTKYLNDKKINIEKMNTSTTNAPITGVILFKLSSIICIPLDLDIKEIKKKMNKLSEQFNVNYNLLLLESK
tara:strand:+ start:172 stop:696 length:525 start_codon:yes stop_codon:yes gene_type:complete